MAGNEATQDTEVVDESSDTMYGGRTRSQSSIKFPYLDQEDAVKFAKAIHAVAGNSCTRDALAGHLKVKATVGAFGQRIGTAKMFGFIDAERGMLSLTPLGKRVIDPTQEKAARAESFLLIPLYKRVFDQYRNQILPANSALEKAMEQMGVSAKQTDKARQAFQRSAQQAGYFAFGSDRLVPPQGIATASEAQEPREEHKVGGEGGNVPPPPPTTPPGPPKPPELPPHVQVLVSKLPEIEKPWSMQGRKKWLDAALKIFDLMYERENDDAADITITVVSNSAN
jgi:hypothetical protein